MREIEVRNHILHLFEAGIELALINIYTHSGEDWIGNREGSKLTIPDLLNDEAIPQLFKTAFKQ